MGSKLVERKLCQDARSLGLQGSGSRFREMTGASRLFC
ncbi:hypothetical protein C4K40_5775 [Pseudomonas sp. CMR5c]|nr:hypothetical protein C4K40_5775 [Pseudomonas sp. CMR5c]